MSTMIGRRGFLQCIVVSAALAAGCSSEEQGTPATPVEEGSRFFPQSVASGDPRATSVVLWTRVEDSELAGSDLTLALEVSLSEDFAALVASKSALPAAAAHDGTLKVKLTGLTARTTYYYRFVYEKAGKRYASRTGRTRTAPAATDESPVRFAIASCQDFIGRHYHVWQRLLDVAPDLDAILFLGDYIYETTGDPSFQSAGAQRAIQLSDPASAIELRTSKGESYYAARSASNYRDLYKQYRADRVLQQVHERWPMVFTWDDHEFSDDSFGATATYTDGLKNELDEERKRNSERVFFEFNPVDASDAPDGRIDPAAAATYPATKIWREFEYGKNVRLIVTDYRTHRPDHLIPEDAFPATVIVDETELKAAGLDTVFSSDSFAYVNIDEERYSGEKFLLTLAIKQLGMNSGLSEADATARAEANVKGNLALVFVNAVLTNEQVGGSPIPPGGRPRGMAWVHFGKRDLYGIRGTRYIVLKDTYDAWTAYQYAKTTGASENVYGAEQDGWIKSRLAAPAPWKIVATSVSMTAMVLDFRNKMDIPDSSLRNRFYANCDGWDGFPNKKKEILEAGGPSTIFVAGDIHATFASVEEGAISVTTPAISSGTFQDLLKGNVIAAGYDETSAVYKYAVTELDASFVAGNPGIAYTNNTHHGIAILEVAASEANVTYHLVPGTEVLKPYEQGAEVKAKFVEKKLKIAGGKITPA